jgi:hypothetical protein
MKIFGLMILATFFLYNLSDGFGQVQKFESQKIQLNQFINEEKTLSQKIDQKFQELQKKSKQIAKLKSKESENILSNRKLQNLLRDSKDLANELDKLESERKELKNQLVNKSKEFIKLIDNELIKEFRKTKNYDRNSSEYKEGVDKLSSLYHDRIEYQPYIKREFNNPIQLFPIEIKQSDSEEILKTKMDLLNDQKDYLLSIKFIIEERLYQTKEWMELTNLAGDLIEDIQLFQTHDEAIISSNNRSSATRATLDAENQFNETDYGKTVAGEWIVPNELLIPIEINNLFQMGPEQLEDQIKKLNHLQIQIQTKADSLAKIIKGT